MMPFLSVVIANYNYGRYLEAAIQSVMSQLGDDDGQVGADEVELIIIDGGSADNSVEIIQKYAAGLPPKTKNQAAKALISYWVSEKDHGQSEAFNKGFAQSTGEFITWLNADDVYMPGTFRAVFNVLRGHPKCDWATGNFIRFTDADKVIIQAEWGPHWLPFCMQGRCFPMMIFGPTTFWRRSIYERLGPIDEGLHYGMDTEYWWRLTVNGYKQVRVNHCCWAFRMHADSKTAEFGTHESSDRVKIEKKREHSYTLKKHGVSVGIVARSAIWLLRMLDGSLLVRTWRKFFVVGRVVGI